MDQTRETEPVIDTTLNVSVTAFEDMLKILSALSNEDALSIFLYSKNSITSSKNAIEDLDLTQKRFYSRLKDLIDVGLIEKVGGEYRQTTLGKITYKLGISMEPLLLNKERLRLADSLQKLDSISSEEKSGILGQILNPAGGGFLNEMLDKKDVTNIEILPSFDKLAERAVEQIKKAQKSILLATNYLDIKVMDASLKAMGRGAVLKCLFSKERFMPKLSKLKLMLSPKALISLLACFDSDIKLTDSLREAKIPFSFIIIDDDECFFELPNIKDDFTMAFYVINKDLSKFFNDLFYNIWEVSEINAWIGFFEKIKEL